MLGNSVLPEENGKVKAKPYSEQYQQEDCGTVDLPILTRFSGKQLASLLTSPTFQFRQFDHTRRYPWYWALPHGNSKFSDCGCYVNRWLEATVRSRANSTATRDAADPLARFIRQTVK